MVEVESMASPEDALNNLMECVLIGFRFDRPSGVVTLVTDYPFTSPGSVREFAALVFEDATFVREQGDSEPMRIYRDSFQATGPGAVVVQGVKVSVPGEGPATASLWFGPNFGGFTVTYGRVTGYTRGSTATQTGPMSWAYRDARTGEAFDFHRPFPTLMPAGS